MKTTFTILLILISYLSYAQKVASQSTTTINNTPYNIDNDGSTNDNSHLTTSACVTLCKVKAYTKSGLVTQQLKVWCDTVTPTSANGYSVDISSAGFTKILTAEAYSIYTTETANSFPIVELKGMPTTTTLLISILQPVSSTTTILGISVLSSSGLQFMPSLTGLKVGVLVIGY